MRKVDLFLSISRFTWERFIAANPEFRNAPHRIMHLGLGSPLSCPEKSPGSPAALMIGRMVRSEDYKGHRETIAAWPLVLKHNPEAVLWIAGEGDLRPELEALVLDLNLRNRIVFWGRVSEQQKETLLRECRCLALPSRGEGFGLVYVEAMRFGRPCLVSNSDAGAEVVNPPEAGLAVDPGSRPQLADALVQLIAGGLQWEDWSRKAMLRYERNFTAMHFQERLLLALHETRSPELRCR